MIEIFKRWLLRRKTKKALAHITTLGLVAVKIKTIAGTDYLQCPNGMFRKIGAEGKLVK